MQNVFVICTGNSCRSVMGEALFNHLGQGRIQAFSAGSHPIGRINAGALATLKRHGLPTEGYKSQSWNEFESQLMDIVITVCDNAAGETCPVYLNHAVRAHWGVSDPGHIEGTEEEKIAAFETTFGILKLRVQKMLALPLETMTADQLKTELNAIGRLTA
ncbi:ArsC family transcriptional regulator [Methylomonas lenta]|uniref:ArsC family transcriptional regulator n=1 Tax=Methylomonas lenta TaxID=980561 RepID=A0A177NM65_9GAMM|nr:arsenate reductase ArsC [Methylomonas lenta]OAI18654.1 ArsC family transcriptional regulator [Methylomonas lenta]